MSGTVRLIPSETVFFAAGKESILDAALHAGVSLNYGCSNGNCGMCKGRVVSGKVERIRHHDYTISAAEKSRGYVLLCSHAANGDIVVEADAASDSKDIPAQKISAKVKTTRVLNDDMMALHIQTPRTHRFRFLAGQAVKLHMPSGHSFVYPIASCPCEDRNIEFHFRRDTRSETVEELSRINHGDAIEIEGPTGNFTLGAATGQRLVFVAWDIGFAPIKSLIEHALQQEEIQCDLHLCTLLPLKAELYLHNVVRAWEDAFDQFRYAPVFLAGTYDEVVADLNAGGNRFREQVKPHLKRLAPLDSASVYIAGPEPVPDLVRSMFVQTGAVEDRVKTATVNPI